MVEERRLLFTCDLMFSVCYFKVNKNLPQPSTYLHHHRMYLASARYPTWRYCSRGSTSELRWSHQSRGSKQSGWGDMDTNEVIPGWNVEVYIQHIHRSNCCDCVVFENYLMRSMIKRIVTHVLSYLVIDMLEQSNSSNQNINPSCALILGALKQSLGNQQLCQARSCPPQPL